jgi:DNA-binding IclR family transcriptional regulator
MVHRYSVGAKRMVHRVCAEYLEMPGLCLTRQQAQRLWGLDEQTCSELLEMLQRRGFLHQTRDGKYARLTEGPLAFSRRRMAKADIDPASVPLKRPKH